MDDSKDGIIWVQKVDDPSAFGVVKLDEEGTITDFVEKPEDFVSDLAIIGIYFFKDGGFLRDELQYLIDNDIKDKGEYQLTNALENMKNKGSKFYPGKVDEWLDCGNKNATVYTNQRILEFIKDEPGLESADCEKENALIIPPCYIGKGVKISNSVIGPHVSIGNGTEVANSVISNTIIQKDSIISGLHCTNSMIGNHTQYENSPEELSIGDYNMKK